ncbi:MAG: adenosylcobinamide amidohydrolase [Candidatus Thermoplasmatota archaeon]|nr:adenosylcobinamide amidohydrolase [Candidatus Thermoplasmatota archaeon]
MRKFSSAPYNGGIGESIAYANRHVERNYSYNPGVEIPQFLGRNNIDANGITVTLTACSVLDFVLIEDKIGDHFLTAAITAGSGNAISMGSKGSEGNGTVNVCVLTDLPLSDSGTLNLYQTIVEAKAQAFNDLGITDRITGKISPGTSTDTVSIFVANQGKDMEFGGRLTDVGHKTSLIVYENIGVALQKCLY